MTRPIEPMVLPTTEPGVVGDIVPAFKWVSPSELLVDDTYQRQLSRQSIDLIGKIVRTWDWARFKPPVVAMTQDGFEVIDGQHTAIAAASHPDIDEIPVMIVGAPEMQDRARAFVGHNRDRLTLSQTQIHYANIAAGDEDALTIQQVCERAGVALLRGQPGNNEYQPGETIALGAIRALVNRRHAHGARVVLQVLADAKCAPVRADGIKAVEHMLFSEDYRNQVTAESICTAIRLLGPKAEQDAKVFAAAHSVPVWKALAVILYRGGKHGRRRAA